MLKVLHIIQGYGGGVSSLVKNLVLHEEGTDIRQDVLSFAYTHGEAFVQELTAHGSRVMQMPRPRKDGFGTFKKYVLSVMKEGSYDVVHCHTDGWRSSIFKKLTKQAGIPLFCIHAHRSTNDLSRVKNHPLYLRFNQRISCKHADIRFACGEKAASFIYGTAENAVIIPNGIDLQRIAAASESDRVSLRASVGVGEDELLLLHVGRLVTAKNHVFLLQIAKALYERGTAFRLLIVGAGELEDSIARMIEQQQLGERVHLLGRRNDILELMAAADMLLLPSYSEGLPTVAVEAQAMGLHSVLSDTITTECDMGLGLVTFLPITDTASLWAEAIERCRGEEICSSEQILQTLDDKAYTSEGAVKRYAAVLHDAVNGRQKGNPLCD